MRDSQLRKIYSNACACLGRQIDEDQYDSWKRILLPFEEADVHKALEHWQGDTTQVEMFGRIRTQGAMMPTPADVKSRVQDIIIKRKESMRFVPCNKHDERGQCADGIYLYRDDKGRTFSRDCDCFREHKIKRAQLQKGAAA